MGIGYGELASGGCRQQCSKIEGVLLTTEEDQLAEKRKQLRRMHAPCAGCAGLCDTCDLEDGRWGGAAVACRPFQDEGLVAVPVGNCPKFIPLAA